MWTISLIFLYIKDNFLKQSDWVSWYSLHIELINFSIVPLSDLVEFKARVSLNPGG